MSWLIISLIGYFLNAIATLISKWLLIKDIPHPVVFVFYIGVMNLVALVLIPFGFSLAGIVPVVTAVMSGISFGWAMYVMAKALRVDQVSQVAPMIGGLQPIFVLVFALWFLPTELVGKQYIGIACIILGSLLIALEFGKRHWWQRKQKIFTASVGLIIISSLLFGLSYALLDLTYIQQGFVSGFVWSRIGTFLFVVVLALLPGNWKRIQQSTRQSGPKAKGWFLFGQIAGAASFVLVAFAISIGPVTIINALQGIQYVFLFLLIVCLSKFNKKLLDEPLTRKIIVQKTVAIVIIMVGLALIL